MTHDAAPAEITGDVEHMNRVTGAKMFRQSNTYKKGDRSKNVVAVKYMLEKQVEAHLHQYLKARELLLDNWLV